MHIADPDYINTVFAFPYRGVTIQITSDTHLGTTIYTAWIDYATGSAVAVPKAYSRSEAIRRAKGWVIRKFKFDLAADS
ncbi:MAG: hypothetical protein AAF282_05620 [Cyanobacteria bacterium P01_A01_bin.15]